MVAKLFFEEPPYAACEFATTKMTEHSSLVLKKRESGASQMRLRLTSMKTGGRLSRCVSRKASLAAISDDRRASIELQKSVTLDSKSCIFMGGGTGGERGKGSELE